MTPGDVSSRDAKARLLVLWHSSTGAAQALARAAADAACTEPEVETLLLRFQDAGTDDLLAAAGYIFAMPENLATMSGIAKDFFDRTYYGALGRIEGRPYAAIVAAGSDGQGAARQLARIAQGWRLRPVAEPVIVCTRAQTPEAILAPKVVSPDELARAAELGAALAAGLSIGIW